MKAAASIVVVIGLAIAASPAQAQDAALTAQTVADAFQAEGIGAESGTDDYGDPYLELQTGGALPSDYANVFFFDCNSAGSCDSMLMVAGFQPQRRPVYLDAINQWNVERRWVRAYIDAENYLVLDMDVSAYGGISEAALGNQVSRFVQSVGDFSQFIRR